MFDTHSHIQFKVFEDNIDEVIDSARDAGVSKIMVVGTDLESSKNAVNLASQFNGVYTSAGIHPHHVFQYFTAHHSENHFSVISNDSSERSQDSKDKSRDSSLRIGMTELHLSALEELISNPKILAIGETGIDRHLYKNTKYSSYTISKEFLDLQKQFFTQQIKLAIKYQKSLIVHNREAVDETLAVLKDNWSEILAGKSVFHCCEPEQKLLDFAKEYGIFIGVDGDVTYDSAKQKFVKLVPLDLLVLETDSPFLVPHPIRHSGKQSAARIFNTPANLKIIAQKIAEILKEDPVKIEKITFENGKKLFEINS